MTSRVMKAYRDFEFHAIYHTVHNFCTVDLSNFYLDVLKDRLYTSGADSRARRAAQTTLYHILDHLVRLVSPVLVFTADEAWSFMPGERAESVHLSAFPAPREDWLDEDLAAKWEKLLEVKVEVSRALEGARKEKIIGHPLDAKVVVFPTDETKALVDEESEALEEILIVSALDVNEPGAGPAETATTPEGNYGYRSEELEGMSVLIEKAPGDKCERCWHYSPSVGGDDDHPTICSKCTEALR